MAHMFKVRGAYLFKTLAPCHIKAMVSGVIIGSEIYDMRELYPSSAPVSLIGSDELAGSYALALDELGIANAIHNGQELTVLGLHLLSKHI